MLNQLIYANNYSKCIKKLRKKNPALGKIVDKVISRLNFSIGIQRAKMVHIVKNTFAIWNISIPDNPSNKGSSGGYRLICVRDNGRNEVLLYWIERRSELQKSHVRKNYEQLLLELKEELLNVNSLQELTVL